MKPTAAVIVFLAGVVVGAGYHTGADHEDADAFISDEKRMDALLSCILATASEPSCDELGKVTRGLYATSSFLASLGEVLATNCAKCSDKQRLGLDKFFKHMAQKRPLQMKQLLDKYDPSGESRRKWADIWKEKGIAAA